MGWFVTEIGFKYRLTEETFITEPGRVPNLPRKTMFTF